jgi:elongation factor P
MIGASRLRAGTTFLLDGNPYKVIKYRHQKLGRGGANVKLSLRNLKTGSLEEKTLNSSYKVNKISTIKKPLQYLYNDKDFAYFMDTKTFEQTQVPISIIENELNFVKEGEKVNVYFWDDKALSVELPPKVTLKVVNTTPGVKGNSATNIYKPAELENGLKIKVPLFINKGDKIIVDTRTAQYVERAKTSAKNPPE